MKQTQTDAWVYYITDHKLTRLISLLSWGLLVTKVEADVSPSVCDTRAGTPSSKLNPLFKAAWIKEHIQEI